MRPMEPDEVALAIKLLQRSLIAERGEEFDVYYSAGNPALVVRRGAEITQENVVQEVPEAHLYMYATVALLA